MATLDSAPASPSLYFASLQPDDFLRWVHDLKAPKTGLHLFYNTYNIKRAVFHYLCELYEWRVHENFEENLSTYISGLKRTLAKDETAKAGKEKEPIPMRLYRRLSEVMLRSTTCYMVFARTFMLLTWNLIARGSRTAAICFSHLGWAEDALRVYFTNSKTD
ncbi:hypothetical protein PHYSODRAFT_482588, partial [Phytophthora sojae]